MQNVMQKRRAVFLDRDGVLNDARVDAGRPYPPKRPEEVVMLPGVADACSRLADAGWLLFMVTNQPDIARGLTTRETVDAINDIVSTGLSIAEILVCPHDDADRCRCRKPSPGMLLAAAEQWNLDLGASVIVGDRWRDIEAGRQAGVRTIFVDRGYSEELRSEPDHVVAGLGDAAELLLARPRASIDDWDSH